MADDLALLDANILVYALFVDSEHHERCRKLLTRASDRECGFCVTSQVLAEFFSVVTNPKRVSVAKTPEEALAAIEAILAMPGVRILPTPVDVARRWIEILRDRPVSGGRIFDLQLPATMLANQVSRIYTLNRADFVNIVTVLMP
jgi:toxin-antitoxin system PIN domain toxin